MSAMQKLIHEQLLEYTEQLKVLEKEMFHKYKAGEDYSDDVAKASGLKLMQKEAVLMMTQYAD
jgi:hypothetical protein